MKLVGIREGERIEQEVVFESDDPSFAGVMRIVWTFEPDGGGTRVTVRAENVPEGIRQEDHHAGMKSTLENLNALLQQGIDP
jgi:uncharacterized protein YndB with AHSA1/START domain